MDEGNVAGNTSGQQPSSDSDDVIVVDEVQPCQHRGIQPDSQVTRVAHVPSVAPGPSQAMMPPPSNARASEARNLQQPPQGIKEGMSFASIYVFTERGVQCLSLVFSFSRMTCLTSGCSATAEDGRSSRGISTAAYDRWRPSQRQHPGQERLRAFPRGGAQGRCKDSNGTCQRSWSRFEGRLNNHGSPECTERILLLFFFFFI